MISIAIEKPALFSYAECLWFLDRGFDECLYRVEGQEVVRVQHIGGENILFRISDGGNALRVEAECGEQHKADIEAFVRAWIDVDTPLAPFYEQLRSVPALSFMPEQYGGLRFIGIPDLFECLCWCVIGQQINLSFAYALKRRLVERYGDVLEQGGNVYRLFPTCEALANADMEELRAMQFSGSKARYIVQIARAFCNGEMSREKLVAAGSRDERMNKLLSLQGVGPWTANYALMKSLRDPDAVPVGDAGLLNALLRYGLIEHKRDSERIDEVFGKFEGYRSHLVLYLWRALSDDRK